MRSEEIDYLRNDPIPDGTEVRIYRNLHSNVFSVQRKVPGKSWRVCKHVREFVVEHAKFIVNETGRQRVLKEKRKNVHAFIYGLWRNDLNPVANEFFWWYVGYNPYEYHQFVAQKGKPEMRPVTCSRWCRGRFTEAKPVTTMEPLLPPRA